MVTNRVKKKQAISSSAGHVLSDRFNDPDLVDRIFDYVVQLLPELRGRAMEVKGTIRREFAGERIYVRSGAVERRQRELEQQVRRMFNGQNASHIARVLGISRATVYRCLKQAGGTQGTEQP